MTNLLFNFLITLISVVLFNTITNAVTGANVSTMVIAGFKTLVGATHSVAVTMVSKLVTFSDVYFIGRVVCLKSRFIANVHRKMQKASRHGHYYVNRCKFTYPIARIKYKANKFALALRLLLLPVVVITNVIKLLMVISVVGISVVGISAFALNTQRKMVNNNKKAAISNKGIVNLLNVFYAGNLTVENKEDEEEEEQKKNEEEKKRSNMTYVQESLSELLRYYESVSKVINKESRFVGDTKIRMRRLIENIQDEIIILTVGIRKKDNFVEYLNRVYVADSKVYINKEGKYIDIINDTIHTAEELKNVEVKVYGALVYSPSQEKKGAITCFKLFTGTLGEITEDKLSKAEDVHIKHLNKATNGMYEQLMKKGEVKFKKCVKANARLSQILAPSKVLGTCMCYAVILDDAGLSSYDGGCHLNVVTVQQFISKCFEDTKFLTEALAGKIMQIRPLGVKGASVTEQPEMLETVLNQRITITFLRDKITPEIQQDILDAFDNVDKSKYRPFWVKRFSDGLKEAELDEDGNFKSWVALKTDDAQLKLMINNSFDGNGCFVSKRTKIGGKIFDDVIRVAYAIKITDVEDYKPDFISDLNSFKAPVDFKIPAKMVVLDMSKEKPGKTRLSMQMLSSLLLLGKPGIEFVRKTMLKNINDSYIKLMEDKKETPKIEDFMSGVSDDEEETKSKFFLIGVMQTGLKHFVLHHDIPAYKAMIENWKKGQIKSIQRLNIFIDGMFERLTADWAYDMAGVEIIKYGECFSGAANKNMDKDSDRFITIFRSPKMGFREFYRAKSLTLTEVKKRIDKQVKDKEIAKQLKFFYSHVQPGTLVLPAGPEASDKVKDLLGGADFDFDGACSVWDVEFNILMGKIAAMVVSVIKPKGGKDIKFKIGVFSDAFKMFLLQEFNGNMSIGEITNMNQLAQLLLYVPLDIVRKLLKRKGCFEPNKAILSTYVSPIAKEKEDALKDKGIVAITEEKTTLIVNAIRNAKIETDEERREIIEDLNIILRGFQERTIDASKTADEIEIVFNLLNDVSLLCLYDKVDININWEEKTVEAVYNDNDTEAKKSEDGYGNTFFYFIINDEFHKVMIDAVKELASLCEKAVARIEEENMGFTPEQIEKMQNAHGKNAQYDGDVIYISNMLSNINQIRINKVLSLQDKKGKISKYDRKVMMPEISKEYNMCRDALQDMLRRELRKIKSPVERAAYVKYMAMHKTDDDGMTTVRSEGGSKLCHSLLPEEYFLLAMELDSEVSKVARTRLDKQDKTLKDGDKITFTNGISESGLIVDKSINGEFVYRVIDKVPYIEAEISKLMDEIMPVIDVNAPKTLVVRVFSKNTKGLTVKEKNKKHAKMMEKVSGWKENEIGLTLKPWSGADTYDKASVIINGEKTTLGKFAAPRGKNSELSKLVKNFKGVITCVNSGEFVREELDEENFDEYGNQMTKDDVYFINIIVAYEKEVEVTKSNSVDLAARMAAMMSGNKETKTEEKVEQTKPALDPKLAAILAKYTKKEESKQEQKIETKTQEKTNVEQEILEGIGNNEYDDLF